MIPTAIPNLSGNEEAYLSQCIGSSFVSSVGPFVSRFEEMVSDICHAPAAAAVSSGTAALHVALRLAGVRAGDLVIMPSFTFIASANAASYLGAGPYLLDIVPHGLTLDPRALEAALGRCSRRENAGLVEPNSGRRVAAIMPVHTLGNVADMRPIKELAEAYDLPVICDGAAALGARYDGRDPSELALFSTYSFNGNKTFTCGGGGAVVSPDAKAVDHARHISATARKGADYHYEEIGFNYRMTNIQAAVGCAQLERFSDFMSAKSRIRNFYNSELADIDWIAPLAVPQWCESACWLSGGVLASDAPLELDAICRMLREEGVAARPFWKPIHLQPPYADSPAGDLKITESVWDRLLILPSSTHITGEELEKVAETMHRIARSKA